MQRNGGADVKRNAVQRLADDKLMGAFGFQHEMLLALHQRLRIRKLFEADTRMRILGGDGFVTEIEREAICSRLADHTGEQDGGRLEWQVGAAVAVAKIPQHCGARAACAIIMRGVNGEGGRAAGDQFLHDHSVALQFLAEGQDRLEGFEATAAADLDFLVMNVAVVGVKTSKLQARRVFDRLREKGGVLARHDAGAGHATVEFEIDAERHPMLLRTGGEEAERLLVIGDGGERRGRILHRQLGVAMRIDADARHGEQHVRRARLRAHLGLGDGGGFVFRDAEFDLPLDERAELVRLHVRTQPLRAAGDLHHELEIVLDALAIQKQRGRGDLIFVFDVKPGVGGICGGHAARMMSARTANAKGKNARRLLSANLLEQALVRVLSRFAAPASLAAMFSARLVLSLVTFALPSVFAEDILNVDPIKAALGKAIAGGQTPGAVFHLEHGNQSAHFALGQRSVKPAKEPMTEDTIFDAASVTKVVATATSVMVLFDQGKIALDAPVRTYLPEFTDEGRDEITVRHLLTHVSGLHPSLSQNPPWSGYETGIKLACSHAPETTPGSAFRYSDINFILLGEIVHRVSGETLDEFAAKHVFEPLKMTSSRFKPPADWLPRIAPTEKDENGVMLRGIVHDPSSRRMGGVAGHAGLFTSAADLARFCRMFLNGGELDGARLLKSETVKLMTSVQTPATVLDRRGLGWDIDSKYSRPRGWHPDDKTNSRAQFPLGSFGHTGFTGTSLWIDPFSHSFAILLTTRLHPDGKGDVRDLYSEIGSLAVKAIPGFDFKNVPGALLPHLKLDEVPTVLNGIDVLARKQFATLKGLRLGLITNHTGHDNTRNVTIDLLAKAPGVKLRALFSPEHGIRGALDQDKIADSKDAKTGLPVFSLYGERKVPSAEQLKELDALVFDIQDIGCRFYTYISTMQLAMEAAAKNEKPFIVLDRVNPIGGVKIEGPVQPTKESFVACHPIPLRHGMTVGELAKLMNHERGIEAKLTVIECEGWKRDLWLDETGLPWTNPSPNMRSLTAAMLYPGIGLLESAISVGRGTDRPFEILGAPYVDDLRLTSELNKAGLSGVRFVPVRFTPTVSTFKDKPCGGAEIIITDRESLNAVDVGIAVACVLRKLYGEKFAVKDMSRLLLDDAALDAIKEGKPWREITAMWRDQLNAFEQRRRTFLIYR